LAVSWVLRRSEVTAAIVGARRPGQITETVQASQWDLSGTDVDEIENLLAERGRKLAGK
jgi:aryl-alcohol dehydrogenase-like predicted oxidoreductase